MNYFQFHIVESDEQLNEKLDAIRNDASVDYFTVQALTNNAGVVVGWCLMVVRFN